MKESTKKKKQKVSTNIADDQITISDVEEVVDLKHHKSPLRQIKAVAAAPTLPKLDSIQEGVDPILYALLTPENLKYASLLKHVTIDNNKDQLICSVPNKKDPKKTQNKKFDFTKDFNLDLVLNGQVMTRLKKEWPQEVTAIEKKAKNPTQASLKEIQKQKKEALLETIAVKVIEEVVITESGTPEFDWTKKKEEEDKQITEEEPQPEVQEQLEEQQQTQATGEVCSTDYANCDFGEAVEQTQEVAQDQPTATGEVEYMPVGY